MAAEKYSAMDRFACNFLCTQDPFAMTCTPSTLSPSTLSIPAVASSTTTQQRGSQGAARGAAHRPARGCAAGKFLASKDINILY